MELNLRSKLIILIVYFLVPFLLAIIYSSISKSLYRQDEIFEDTNKFDNESGKLKTGMYEIVNKFSGQYLITSQRMYDSNRRYIFSMRHSTSHTPGNKWRLKYEKIGNCYLVTSRDFPTEYLYVDHYMDKTQTLNVFLTSDKEKLDAYDSDAYKWAFILLQDGSFYIKNLFKQQYLYEFYYDFDTNGNQYVFVSKNISAWTKLNNDKRKWILK